ncbi:MAG: hypothetical protein ABI675_01080 [Chitinophagaceae bacterium]
MNFLSKIFGLSKLEEEFKKAIGLTWIISIENITKVQFYFRGNILQFGSEGNTLLFNFLNCELLISGRISEEIFQGQTHFYIKQIINNPDEILMFLGPSNENQISTAKCRVNRNHISFEGTLDNWHCKLTSGESWKINKL